MEDTNTFKICVHPRSSAVKIRTPLGHAGTQSRLSRSAKSTFALFASSRWGKLRTHSDTLSFLSACFSVHPRFKNRTHSVHVRTRYESFLRFLAYLLFKKPDTLRTHSDT